MLHILFIALKVIGYILLTILCIILLILAIILVSPFRYQLSGEGNLKEKMVASDVSLSWLMRLIRVDARFRDMKLAWRVKVAWLTVMQDGFEENKKQKGDQTDEGKYDKNKRDDDEQSEEIRPEQTFSAEKSDSKHGNSNEQASTEGGTDEQASTEGGADEQASAEGRADKQASTEGGADEQTSAEGRTDEQDYSIAKTEEADEESSEEEKEISSEKTEEKSIKFEELKEKILEINEKIKIPFRKIEEFQENLETKLEKAGQKYNEIIEIKDDIVAFIEVDKHKKAFFKVIHAVLYIIKKYLPRKGDIHLHFGLGDPYRTGVVFALLSVIDPLTGGNIYATPEADEWMLEGSLSVKGHIRLVHLPIAVLSLAISPAIWKTVMDARKLKILKK